MSKLFPQIPEKFQTLTYNPNSRRIEESSTNVPKIYIELYISKTRVITYLIDSNNLSLLLFKDKPLIF
jgi:hypothetical protein